MALEKKKLSEIPPDAVMLSEEEALKYHYKLLNHWKIPSDVVAYKYGSFLLSAASMVSGVYINNHFRTKLKLRSYGRMSSYLPISIVPAIMSLLLHHELVLKELVLLKQQHCPVCIELRAATVQTFFGAVMPFVLAPLSSFLFTHKYGTYSVPHISQPLEVVKEVGKLSKPIKNILFGIFIGQAILGSVVTYLEAQSIFRVDSKLAELERNLEHSGRI